MTRPQRHKNTFYCFATILIRCNCLEEVVVAGILHDTIEDTPPTIKELRDVFGEKVADIVQTVSANKS